ncbi:MAG TPA: DUF3179 domain-containing (seleno)protein [Ohtaekwangia sp.]
MKGLLFFIGILVLILAEVFKVYFIMPFPGSQQSNTVDLAYFLHTNIQWIRVVGILMIAYPVFHIFREGRRWAKITITLAAVVYLVVYYFVNFEFLADKMFLQPEHKVFASSATNEVPSGNLVVGVFINGEAKAYPIQYIGYHHQVRDSVGGKPVMVTYCTVCRTGRVFSPMVKGNAETFRLVGMDHFNAMFEDASTGSWWRQVNGEAVTGPLKGESLEEIPAEQMRLDAWIGQYPNTLIMQPDTSFSDQYYYMRKYDSGKGQGELTRTDSLSWKEKSWVVGVQIGASSRAYDWHDLVANRVLNDTLAKTPIVVALANDSVTFHVWKRDTLLFEFDKAASVMRDRQTKSTWNDLGYCTDGPLKGTRLPVVQSYQEFWHSWRTFRPGTTRFLTAN